MVLTVFVLCWTWALIEAIVTIIVIMTDVVVSSELLFASQLVYVIMCPLQGFLNFAVKDASLSLWYSGDLAYQPCSRCYPGLHGVFQGVSEKLEECGEIHLPLLLQD